jgi:hypothetical protein
MIRLLADENFDNRIVRGLRRRFSSIEILTVQDLSLGAAGDPELLEWAAKNIWLIVTHDVKTFPKFAYQRIHEGLPMSGLVASSDRLPIRTVIDDLQMIVECSEAHEWQGRVEFLPI